MALQSYWRDIMNDIRGEKSWSSETSTLTQGNSSLMNSKDPIQALLLVETALNDTREFEILSLEEVENMKMQCESITQQITQTRQNLKIQSKYLDAAETVAKLYSSDLTSHKTAGKSTNESKDQVQHNDQELMASKRRCKELAINLFRLEKELMITQGILLKHTARVLQMSYDETQDLKKNSDNSESTYTFANDNKETESIDNSFLFDERSLYRALEGLDEGSDGTELASKLQMNVISRTEEKLVFLNNKVRQIIDKVKLDSEKKSQTPPSSSENGESLEMLQAHLEFLEQSINTIDIEQDRLTNHYKEVISQNSGLLEQKEILQCQIKQQRDQNNLSDSHKDAHINEKVNELAKTTELHTKTKIELDDLQKQVDSLGKKLVEAQKTKEFMHIAEDRAHKSEEASRAALAEIKNRDQRIFRLGEQLKNSESNFASAHVELKSKTASLEAQIKVLEEKLASAVSDIGILNKSITEKESKLVDKEREITEAQMDIARLQTELTIAKAELDGAYGSRAQRVAEMAVNPTFQNEINRLTSISNSQASEIAVLKVKLAEAEAGSNENVTELRHELTETIEEYENLTKASIEWEKEREQLEKTIDSLREAKENTEAQLYDEKVQWMGMRNPDAEALSPPSTSTTVLKTEFKRMIRDIRAENAKLLKAEQSERRRLEDEMRRFRKARLSPTSLDHL